MMRGLAISIAAGAVIAACASSDQMRRRQYEADYQRALARCGHPEVAFQAGYNSGYGGERMRGEWAELCVPSARQATVAAYQDGFLRGAGNAPVRVQHSVQYTPTARASSSRSQCTFDSDCGGGGLHCRNHVCMGNAEIGERCTFNDDCLNDHCFAGTCRE